MTDLLLELGIDTDRPQQEKYPNVYRAVRHSTFGVDYDGKIVCGLTLKEVAEGNWYDPLKEELDNVGVDAELILPPEGLVEGAYYDSCAITTAKDYFTGELDYHVIVRRIL